VVGMPVMAHFVRAPRIRFRAASRSSPQKTINLPDQGSRRRAGFSLAVSDVRSTRTPVRREGANR